jgi:hypothetical protein
MQPCGSFVEQRSLGHCYCGGEEDVLGQENCEAVAHPFEIVERMRILRCGWWIEVPVFGEVKGSDGE